MDFGLAAIIYDTDTVNEATAMTGASGSTRWMAPEILDPESAGLNGKALPLPQSDVHSFAMVAWEVR